MFYRWAFFPKRKPDFQHGLYVYWFDEKIAYSELLYKKKLKLYEVEGILCQKGPTGTHYPFTGFESSVQLAYKQHMHKKFEEIVLSHESR